MMGSQRAANKEPNTTIFSDSQATIIRVAF